MLHQGHHSGVDPQKAFDHLRADPGLPTAEPLPSLWQEPPTEPIWAHQSPTLPRETDVVIIGSGITGCSVARHLLQSDDRIKVTMLEARTITSGATGRNGGQILTVPELFYAGAAGVHGKEFAKEFVRFTIDNQDALLNLATSLPPAVRESSELRQIEQLHVFSSETARANATALIDLLDQEFGDVERRTKLVSKEQMLEKHGIRNSFGGATVLAGAAWPYRLITGILAQLWQEHHDRFSIEAVTPAQSIGWSDALQMYSIQTPRGTINAKNVVHATNAHAGHLLPSLRGFLHPLRCIVSVQEKAPEFENLGANHSLCITAPGALTSVYQSTHTGDLYVSGLVGVSDFFEDYSAREDKTDAAVIEGLSTVLNKTYGRPVQGPVKSNWTGIMAYTADGFPLIGKLDQDLTGRAGTGEYIAAGYNGYGMVGTWLCGEHIADIVLGRREPRKIPALYNVSKARIDKAPLEPILGRTFGTWE